MATRAERFRYEAQRTGPKRTKKPPPEPRSFQVDTALPNTSASDRRHGGPSTAARNLSNGRKATYVLEDTLAPAAPSRKSTRRSKGRHKTDAPLKARQERLISSPARRHREK